MHEQETRLFFFLYLHHAESQTSIKQKEFNKHVDKLCSKEFEDF